MSDHIEVEFVVAVGLLSLLAISAVNTVQQQIVNKSDKDNQFILNQATNTSADYYEAEKNGCMK